jgi:hypothetical protein
VASETNTNDVDKMVVVAVAVIVAIGLIGLAICTWNDAATARTATQNGYVQVNGQWVKESPNGER